MYGLGRTHENPFPTIITKLAQRKKVGYTATDLNQVSPISLKVILQFNSSRELWEFKSAIGATCVQINTAVLRLDCDCSEAEIALAKDEYNAVLIENHISLRGTSIMEQT